MIETKEMGGVSQRLVEATKEGPAAEWVERIAAVARRADLRVAWIDWVGSPFVVAWRVVDECARFNNTLHPLTQELDNLTP